MLVMLVILLPAFAFCVVIHLSRIRNYLESHREEMIDFLAELVSVRSVKSEPDGDFPFGKKPAEALNVMLRKCAEFGFVTENADNYAGSADFGSEPVLAVLSHLDVVPEGDCWTSDPYTLKRENGILTGRGTCDDKGPAVASLFALRAIKELGIPLKKGVRLIFGTDEENGSADMEYYRRSHSFPPMVFTPDGEYPVINGEKGMLRVTFSADFPSDVIVSAGEAVNAVPAVCRESVGGETSVYSGKSAHASTPEKGVNAITLYLESKVCSGSADDVIKNLAALFPHGDFSGKAVFGEIDGMTCVLSVLNSFNSKIVGKVDVRFPIGLEKGYVSGVICEKLASCGFEVESCTGTEPHYTDEKSPFIQSLLKSYEKITGEKGCCITIGGGTYVHEIEGGVAFGSVFPGEDCNMHSADEFITEENFIRNAEIMAEAIIEICG